MTRILQLIVIPLVVVGSAQAALNSACSVRGTPGVCISSSSCTNGGGTSHTGFCPNDPAHIRCCTKNECGRGGDCRFVSACGSGNTVAGLCPGPTNFKCCLPAANNIGSSEGSTSSNSNSATGNSNSKSCGIPKVNQATVKLIKEFEGFVASPAPDPIGLATVGYGHRCRQRNCGEVPYPFPLTHQSASALLQSDLRTFTKCISQYVKKTVRLNENQFGALASWAFNVGCGAVQESSLIRRLNNGENPGVVVEQELPKWNKAGGHVLPGLTRRRAEEVRFFKTPSNVIAHPPAC